MLWAIKPFTTHSHPILGRCSQSSLPRGSFRRGETPVCLQSSLLAQWQMSWDQSSEPAGSRPWRGALSPSSWQQVLHLFRILENAKRGLVFQKTPPFKIKRALWGVSPSEVSNKIKLCRKRFLLRTKSRSKRKRGFRLLEQWARSNKMEFNRNEFKVLHVGPASWKGNRVVGMSLGNSHSDKDLLHSAQ